MIGCEAGSSGKCPGLLIEQLYYIFWVLAIVLRLKSLTAFQSFGVCVRIFRIRTQTSTVEVAILTRCSGVGNANALLGSVCLATLRVAAKLHVYGEANGDR